MLGTFEQAVLLAVLRLASGAYGRAILTDAHTRLKRDVTAGTVYATLDRLEEKGLLSSHLEDGSAMRAGRPRRYHQIERAGIEALNESRSDVDHLWRGFRRRPLSAYGKRAGAPGAQAAERIDGVDLSRWSVGQVIRLLSTKLGC